MSGANLQAIFLLGKALEKQKQEVLSMVEIMTIAELSWSFLASVHALPEHNSEVRQDCNSSPVLAQVDVPKLISKLLDKGCKLQVTQISVMTEKWCVTLTSD